MKNSFTVTAFAAVLTAGVLAIVTYTASGSQPTPDLSNKDRIERGRYIVHQVGMCIDCHSPRDAKGEFIESKHLTGSPLGFVPTVPMPWMPAAPRIAGLPAGFTSEDTIHFLMTGERPNGRPGPLPPMPPYRFERTDAEAVVAYLKSLPPAAP